MRETTLQTPRSVKEGGGGAQDVGSESLPLQLAMKTRVRQVVPLQSTDGPRWSRYPPVASGGPHAGVGGCLKEAVTPWGGHVGAGFCQDLQTCGERSPCWSSLFLKDCTPWKGPTLGQFVKSCSPWKGSCWRSLWRTLSHGRNLHPGARAEC